MLMTTKMGDIKSAKKWSRGSRFWSRGFLGFFSGPVVFWSRGFETTGRNPAEGRNFLRLTHHFCDRCSEKQCFGVTKRVKFNE